MPTLQPKKRSNENRNANCRSLDLLYKKSDVSTSTRCFLLSRKDRQSQNYETPKSFRKIGVYTALEPFQHLLTDLLFEKSKNLLRNFEIWTTPGSKTFPRHVGTSPELYGPFPTRKNIQRCPKTQGNRKHIRMFRSAAPGQQPFPIRIHLKSVYQFLC